MMKKDSIKNENCRQYELNCLIGNRESQALKETMTKISGWIDNNQGKFVAVAKESSADGDKETRNVWVEKKNRLSG